MLRINTATEEHLSSSLMFGVKPLILGTGPHLLASALHEHFRGMTALPTLSAHE
jgi:hypothetical protein